MAGSSEDTDKAPQNRPNGSSSDPTAPARAVESELAKALQELARGEQAASSLENDLSRLEAKLDEILAGLDPEVVEAADAARAQNPEPAAKNDEKQE